jgi:hypothetical protein
VTERDPRILPGSSAKTRERQLLVAIWGSTALLPLSIVAAGLVAALGLWRERDIGVVLVVLIGFVLVVMVAGAFWIYEASRSSTRRQQAEIAAGYTTLLKRYDHVDGIDQRTGVVVRPEIPRRPSGSIGEAIGSGSELGDLDTGRGPFGVAARTPWASIGAVASVLALAASIVGISYDPNNASGWLWVLGFVGLLGVIVFPSFGLAYTPTTFYVRALQVEYPRARVFPGTPNYADVVGELVPSDAPRLEEARSRASGFLVFESDRVVFFSRSRTRLIPFLEIPRSRIHSAHIGSVMNAGGLGNTAAVLSVTKDDGSSLDITLGFGPSRIASPMKIAIEMDDSAIWARNWITAR